jgi:hypothetical protein
VRTSVGSGYVLSETVLAAEECKPIRKARIEFWHAAWVNTENSCWYEE